MATSLDQLRQQTIPKMEALFQRLDQEQRKMQSSTYTPPFTTTPQNRYRGNPDGFPTTADFEYRRSPTDNKTPAVKVSPATMDVPSPEVSKGNTLTGYATVWYNQDGREYIDTYQDWVAPGSWLDTIRERYEEKRIRGRDWLLPYLWQHRPQDIIGKVVHLEEDRKGVFYETKLSMGVQRARECYELAKQGVLGCSFGYDPIQYMPTYMNGKTVRVLKAIKAHEISAVTFPANELTTTYAKARPYTSLKEADQDMQRLMQSLKKQRELTANLEQRQQVIDRLAYDLDCWFRGADVAIQLQQSSHIPSRQKTEVHDAMARLDDLFNDFDIMLTGR